MYGQDGADRLLARIAFDLKADKDNDAKISAKKSLISGKSSARDESSRSSCKFLVTLGIRV